MVSTVKKARLALLLISIFALLLTACGSETEGTTTTAVTEPDSSTTIDDGTATTLEEATTSTAAPATVRVALNWSVPEYTHSGITQAIHDGYFTDQSLEVELQPLSGSSAAVQAVASGAADIGMAGAEAILAGFSEELPLIVVANHLQKSPIGVLYRGDAEVTSFEDLAGLTIAVSATGNDTVALMAFLTNAGLDPEEDVDIQFVDPDIRCNLLVAGTVDACTGFSTGQLVRAQQEDPTIRFLPFQSGEIAPLGHSIFTTPEYLEENGEVVRRFLQAAYEGYLAADADLDTHSDVYVEAYPLEALDLYRESVEQAHILMKSERTDEHGWGWMEDQPWADLQALLIEGDAIENETPVGQIYTNEYLPETAPFG